MWHNLANLRVLVQALAPSGGLAGLFTSLSPRDSPWLWLWLLLLLLLLFHVVVVALGWTLQERCGTLKKVRCKAPAVALFVNSWVTWWSMWKTVRSCTACFLFVFVPFPFAWRSKSLAICVFQLLFVQALHEKQNQRCFVGPCNKALDFHRGFASPWPCVEKGVMSWPVLFLAVEIIVSWANGCVDSIPRTF